MNTYEQPKVEIIKFEVPNIITVSTEDIEHDNSYGDFGDL